MYDDAPGDDKGRQNTKEAERSEGNLSADRARDHPVRLAILATLAKHGKNKGLTTRQVDDLLPGDPPLGAVAYHLRALLEAELVKVSGNGEGGWLP